VGAAAAGWPPTSMPPITSTDATTTARVITKSPQQLGVCVPSRQVVSIQATEPTVNRTTGLSELDQTRRAAATGSKKTRNPSSNQQLR
jgi:hypothetical protein